MKKIFVLLCIILIASQCSFATGTATNPNNGRYVIYMHPQFAKDIYLLDTHTGMTWKLVAGKEVNSLWEQVGFLNHSYNNKTGKPEVFIYAPNPTTNPY